ncbi:MAG: 6-pyruvoyl-tetrahydropterin synthase-related protein [Candidatus Sumerlaeota bacterium]|nr:6-pyruvoyl-tetrahydropterin synthase-related protein [Candidatus Sumerlaeota bacterium]
MNSTTPQAANPPSPREPLFAAGPRRRVARRREGWAVLILILLFSLVLVHPLLRAGYPASGELDRHPLRLLGLTRAVAEGVWDGRWLGSFAQGFGYPFFTFYAPGLYYLSLAFLHLGFSLAGSIKAGVIVFSLAGAIGQCLLGRALWRSRMAGGLAALVWLFLPYQVFNLYSRGDLAEYCAASLIPWALYGHLAAMRRGEWKAALGASLAHAAILWTHNVTALVFQAFLLVFDGLFVPLEARNKRRAALRLIVSHALGLGLAAAFWLPALVERRFVHIDLVVLPESHYDPTTNLLGLYSILSSFARGLGWLIAAGSAASAALCLALRDRRSRDQWRLAALGLLAGGAVFLMLPASRIFWARAPLASFVQFPWRLLSFAGLALSLIVGASGRWLERRAGIWKGASLVLTGGASLALVAWEMHPAAFPGCDDASLTEKLVSRCVTTVSMSEYLPYPAAPFPDDTVLARSGGARRIVEGQATLDPSIPGASKRAAGRGAVVTAETAVVLQWDQHYYPAWTARLDGVNREPHPSPEGLILLDVPPGRHTVEFVLSSTSAREAGRAIALLALLAAMAIAGFGSVRPRQ